MKATKLGGPVHVAPHEDAAEVDASKPSVGVEEQTGPVEDADGARDEFAHGGTPSSTATTGFPATTKHAGTHALLQVAALRGKGSLAQKGAPETAGARMTLLGAALHAVKQGAVSVLKVMVRPRTLACVVFLMGIHGQLNPVPAQSVYVNVNGAKAHYAEVLGAKTAAQRMGEPFSVVRPSELAPIFERANAPDGTLRKLIISGHSSGLWISGSDEQGGNSIGIAELQSLKQQYPAAFSKVKLFFGMACNIGTEENSRQWFSLFPNVNAVVGFDHIGPANTRPAAGAVLNLVDAELQNVNWKTLTRDGAMQLAKRLSRLPGVNVTEFAIRLRANDGSSVYFSKLNQPTSLSSASDVVEQLRPGSFTAYFEAKEPQYARPPADHGPRNPLRAFYNASQTLLNAMGRDLTARGVDPSTDASYQRVTAEKEAALRLVYFETVLQNVEHHMRAQMDSVQQELAQVGVSFTIPKLDTMSRAEITKLTTQLGELGNYTLSDFSHRNTADIAAVTQFLGADAISFSDVNSHIGSWQLGQLAEKLTAVRANDSAPAEVKDAAARLLAALETAPSASFQSLLKLFDEGLVKLQVGAFPSDWVTTERPRV